MKQFEYMLAKICTSEAEIIECQEEAATITAVRVKFCLDDDFPSFLKDCGLEGWELSALVDDAMIFKRELYPIGEKAGALEI